MLTALTRSKKTHQIATGFDQSSHATLKGLPPQALPNAHESVIRPTYKARSSQTFGPPRPAVHRAKARREFSGAVGHLDVPGFMSRMRAALDLRVLNALFIRLQGVPSVSQARGFLWPLDPNCAESSAGNSITTPAFCLTVSRRHALARSPIFRRP